MPELPEVETVCRGLNASITGTRITDATAHRADLRGPMPAHLGKRLMGRRIACITRRAKYILIALDKRETLLLHLGMSGRIVVSPDNAPLRKHDHISLVFDNGIHLRFNDPRRFGFCDLIPTDRLGQHKLLANLGIEPLGDSLTPAYLAQILKGRRTTIKTALLDQRLVVGIGNIYACEALFHAGINPERIAGSCTPTDIKKLVSAIIMVLNAAIKAGGSSLRDYVQTDGTVGSFQNHFAVYGREGHPCPDCHCQPQKTGGILRIAQGGRSTFYCPTRQK